MGRVEKSIASHALRYAIELLLLSIQTLRAMKMEAFGLYVAVLGAVRAACAIIGVGRPLARSV